MAEAIVHPTAHRYALVTGANRGIGFEICKQLASKGIMVILTSRNEKRGTEAQERLKEFGLSDNVVFHQLDVVDPASIAAAVDFIRTKYGRLDILVNNAGISGIGLEGDVLVLQEFIEADLASLLAGGKLLSNEWAKGVLSSEDSLTEAKIDEVVQEFLKNFQEGTLEDNHWSTHAAAYKVSKAALNAYTRFIAKKHPRFYVNSVCPGFARTDITCNLGPFSAEEAAEGPVRLALLPEGGPSGSFFNRKEVLSL